ALAAVTVRSWPAIVSAKSAGWTEPGSIGSLGKTRTSVVESARALTMSGETTSAGTVTVANSEVPPLLRVRANVVPGAGSPAKLYENAPAGTVNASRNDGASA